MSHWLTSAGTVELTIYPPGTPQNARRWADAYCTAVKSQWWMPAAAIFITAGGILTGSIATGILPAAAVMAAPLALTRQLGRRVLRDARTLRGCVTAATTASVAYTRIDEALVRLDELDTSGLDLVAYEARWGEEFRRLTKRA